jgi:signal peptidase I
MPQQTAPETRTSIKETLTSILIALVIAFTVRGFVVEAFVIPTGSMAPTLLGANMLVRSKETGYQWTVGPEPTPNGGAMVPPTLQATDIMSMQRVAQSRPQVRAGDRIFVLKYLEGVYEPKRFDVVVFKNPTDPTQNYIKRLVGLPGEQLALVDGDVFSRTPQPTDPADANPWELPGWTCAVKSYRTQLDMWQDVADTHFAPLGGFGQGKPSPWKMLNVGIAGDNWRAQPNGEMAFQGSEQGSLFWDAPDRLTDRYSYNEYSESLRGSTRYPVSDLRLQLFVTPQRDSFSSTANLWARGHDYQVITQGSTVQVRARTSNSGELTGAAPLDVGEWKELGTFPRPAIKANQPLAIDIWFVDQSIQVFEGDTPLGPPILLGWSPDERLRFATRMSAADAMASPSRLWNPAEYRRPRLQWDFAGGPFTIHRTRVQRDIFYRPVSMAAPARQRSPRGPVEFGEVPGFSISPQTTMNLSSTQYFVCGDNSPASLDARHWPEPDPLVAQIDPTLNVVPKALMIGRAFFVYFPAWERRYGIPIPDVGRMRWIW